MNFSEALSQLKTGGLLRRQDWPAGEYVFLVRGSTFAVNRAPLLGIYEPGTLVTYGDHIDKRFSDGDIAPWTPSHGDLMSDDWVRATVPRPSLVPAA